MTSEQLDKLFAEIEKRRSAAPDSSYSAQLLADLPRATRKLGEEAVETIIAALQQDDAALTAEAGELLPRTLGEAIDAFEASDLYRSRLGDAVVDYLVALKRSEWHRFLGAVTDWEQQEYFGRF